MDTPAPNPVPSNDPGIASVAAGLVRVRRILRTLLIVERTGWLIAGAVATLLVVALLDYVLRTPGWLRTGLLAVLIASLIAAFRSRVRPAINFRPGVEELALRLERTEPARGAGLSNVLASGVNLGTHLPGAGEGSLAQPVVAAASRGFAKLPLSKIINPTRAIVASLLASVAVLSIPMAAAFEPALTWIGLRRVLVPWSDASWPRRTEVVTLARGQVHPLGSALAIQGALLKGIAGPEGTRIDAHYRIRQGDIVGPERRVTLTNQERSVSAMRRDERGQDQPATGVLFERLLEPGALVLGDNPKDQTEGEIEYWLTTSDDRTPSVKLKLVPPPAIESALATIEPPAYASGLVPRRELDLGPGTDERASVTGVLAGSPVKLMLTFNKPLPKPASSASGLPEDWLIASLGGALRDELLATGGRVEWGERSVTLSWPARSSVRMAIKLVDQFGVESTQESSVRVEVVPDRAPEVTITKPAEDLDVLPTASVPWSAEARDDLSLVSLTGQYRIATKAQGSQGAAPEPTGNVVTMGSAAPTSVARTLTVGGTLELSSAKVVPGQELWLSAVAIDAFPDQSVGGRPATSPVRKLRVISPEQFAEQVWSELSGVRRSAMRLSEQQERLRQDVQRGKDSAQAQREQQGVSENLTRMNEAIEKINKRVEQSNIGEPELSAIIRETKELGKKAEQAAAQAGQQLREAQQSERDGQAQQAKDQRDGAQKQQDQSARTLDQLAEALDRGQDSWTSKRALERLVQDQKDLRQQTGKFGQETVGKNAQQLTGEQRQQADQLAQKQEELAQRTSEAIDKMNKRAEQLQKTDPATAQALQQAAQRGAKANVSEQMQQSAKQIRENQQQNAQQQQEASAKTLENMLEELKQASKSRDATLKRELASLIESLDTLIKLQELNLAALVAAIPQQAFAGLDAQMIRLHTATLAVADQARSSGRETRSIAETIDAAATAQSQAITGLRAASVDAANVQTSEDESLTKLKQAREQAQKLQDQAQKRDEDRQRAELKKAYREMLTEQTEIVALTNELAGKELDRRSRLSANQLGDRQEALKLKARELLDKTQELKDADMFALAHERLDAGATASASALREPKLDGVLKARQAGVVRVLQSLVDALSEDKDEKDFREGEQGGGDGNSGGGQPQGVLPPIAQLKLLRSLQGEALALTRAASEAAGEDASRLAGEALKLQTDLTGKAQELQKKLEQQQR
jgi:hypothetical protein